MGFDGFDQSLNKSLSAAEKDNNPSAVNCGQEQQTQIKKINGISLQLGGQAGNGGIEGSFSLKKEGPLDPSLDPYCHVKAADRLEANGDAKGALAELDKAKEIARKLMLKDPSDQLSPLARATAFSGDTDKKSQLLDYIDKQHINYRLSQFTLASLCLHKAAHELKNRQPELAQCELAELEKLPGLQLKLKALEKREDLKGSQDYPVVKNAVAVLHNRDEFKYSCSDFASFLAGLSIQQCYKINPIASLGVAMVAGAALKSGINYSVDSMLFHHVRKPADYWGDAGWGALTAAAGGSASYLKSYLTDLWINGEKVSSMAGNVGKAMNSEKIAGFTPGPNGAAFQQLQTLLKDEAKLLRMNDQPELAAKVEQHLDDMAHKNWYSVSLINWLSILTGSGAYQLPREMAKIGTVDEETGKKIDFNEATGRAWKKYLSDEGYFNIALMVGARVPALDKTVFNWALLNPRFFDGVNSYFRLDSSKQDLAKFKDKKFCEHIGEDLPRALLHI